MRSARPRRHGTPTRRSRTIAALACVGLLLAACGGGDDTSADPASETDDSDAAEESDASDEVAAPELTTEEITLTWWTWGPDNEASVALFEEAYPNITVEIVNAGQGTEQYERIRTALTAGSGAPDIAHFATANLAEFVLRDALVDLTEFGLDAVEGDYAPGAWGALTFEDGLYGLPWDTGPLAFLYREDIFEEYGLEVPETWDDFAEAARDLNAQNPDIFLAQFPGVIAEMWLALNWQLGNNSFSVEGDTVGFNLTNDVAQDLVDFWEPLLEEGVLATDPAFTTEWFSSLASGRYAAWIAPSWGPGLLQGAAEDSAGLWRAAPLPQWEAGANASAYWGGSTISVLQQSEHPAEAAELVRFLLNEEESARNYNFLFPTLTSILEDPEWRDQPYEFYGGQAVNQIFAEMELGVDNSWQWSPIQGFVDVTLNTELAQGADQADLMGALERAQNQIVQHAEDQGFTVE
ncbi:MAG: sugar ABC transporter substrate-binding protein [Nitriliruptoraceae bacterium]|nr:sugar ABC transporter substrate-binding protein [Nitriliruptoraceae bacterium]